MMQVKIDEKAFENAIKRHDENFEKDLKEVDVRKVALKVKKSVLEQAKLNNRMYNKITDQSATIRSLTKNLSICESKVDHLKNELTKCKDIFTSAVDLLESEKKKKKKSFFAGFWEFLKCLMR